MAVVYSRQGPNGPVEIHVGDPGFGYLYMVTEDDAGWHDHMIAGNRLWRLLQDLTELATSEDRRTRKDLPFLGRLTPKDAAGLLPALQSAVLYATAGTDRAEHMDDHTLQPPLCVRCDVDVMWATANPHPNPWCEEHGHVAFGVEPGGPGWETEKAYYAEQKERA